MGDSVMNEAGKKIFHFNSNIRSKSGSKASMSNNEDRYLRALEIQELKREIREELQMDININNYFMTVKHQYTDFHLTMKVYKFSSTSFLQFV